MTTDAKNTVGFRKRRSLFRDLNTKLQLLDPSLGSEIVCPICWRRFGVKSLEDESLSIEDVPPVKASRLIREHRYKTLTCKSCNNTMGTQTQRDLKQFLVAQLHLYGKYDRAIPGTITLPGVSPLHSNITFASDKVKISGVPKANNPATTQKSVRLFEEVVESGTTDCSFDMTLNYGCHMPIVLSAYLHIAYLMAFIATDCRYGYADAGSGIRRRLNEANVEEVGPCVIQPPLVGVGGKPWVALIAEPVALRCYWVKVAGNIVILPLGQDGHLSCYQAWQDVCGETPLNLLAPPKISYRIKFRSKEDAIEAAKCLPGLSVAALLP